MPCTGSGTGVQPDCIEQCQRTLAIARLLSALLRGQFKIVMLLFLSIFIILNKIILNKNNINIIIMEYNRCKNIHKTAFIMVANQF